MRVKDNRIPNVHLYMEAMRRIFLIFIADSKALEKKCETLSTSLIFFLYTDDFIIHEKTKR